MGKHLRFIRVAWFFIAFLRFYFSKKNLKNGKFLDLVTSKSNFGGYFQ